MAQLKGSGVNDKRKVAIAATLGVVVLLLALHTILGGPGTTVPSPPPSTAPPLAGHTATSARASSGSFASLDPTLHPEWMAATENYLYTGSGRNIFSASSAPAPGTMPIERVKAPVRPSEQSLAAANAPAGPPVINLRFYGYSLQGNGQRRAFLKQGDVIFVAREGDVVGHRYKVVQIQPTSVRIEDLPYGDTQTLPLAQD